MASATPVTAWSDKKVGGVVSDVGPRREHDFSAWIASLAFHLAVVCLLGFSSMAMPRRVPALNLDLTPILEEEVEVLPEEYFASPDVHDAIGALSAGGAETALAQAQEFHEESVVAVETDALADVGLIPDPLRDQPVFQGPEVSERLPVQGVGSVGTRSAAGAVDRLTLEILASLEQRPTLVVWLFDESGSLSDQRAEILKRFHRIYEELGVIEASSNEAFRKHKDKPLLTSVLGFESDVRTYTDRPTDRIEEIDAAVQSIDENVQTNEDRNGTENVFQAISVAAEDHRVYRTARQGRRHVMIVAFTDEAGDDLDQLDATTVLCRKLAMPVYVVGPPAPFGREVAYVKWIDPDPAFDQRPQWAPVRLGPESLFPERLKLRFANQGDDELLDSGFGPYGLTRLCYETGGLYFASHPNRTVGREIGAGEIVNLSAHFSRFFDSDAMRKYQPDYVSLQQYQQLLSQNRARAALARAAQLTWTSTMEDVPMRFPKRDEASLAQALSEAQRNAALLQPKIDAICALLLDGEPDRGRLREPRWQAGYDLALGTALAVQVRTAGYNAMLAMAKQGLDFRQQDNNTWLLAPNQEFANSALEKGAEKALTTLRRVCEDHPQTPWALLAQRQLDEPLGWSWDETYTQFETPNEEGDDPSPSAPEPTPERRPRRDPPPL